MILNNIYAELNFYYPQSTLFPPKVSFVHIHQNQATTCIVMINLR